MNQNLCAALIDSDAKVIAGRQALPRNQLAG